MIEATVRWAHPVAVGVYQAFYFTCRYLDKDTGLQNNLHRWYDASIGRWIGVDLIGFAARDAKLYCYVGNAPTMNIDPTGLWEWPRQGKEDDDQPSPGRSGDVRTRAGGDGMRRGAFGAPSGGNACDNLQQGRQMAGGLLRDTGRDVGMEVVGVGIAATVVSKADDAYDWYNAGNKAKKAQRVKQYVESGKRIFPTRGNSGLTSGVLRAEQKQFFKCGLEAGKHPAELRGQAAAAGYRRVGGVFSEHDRLSDRGAEQALQEAIKEIGELKKTMGAP